MKKVIFLILIISISSCKLRHGNSQDDNTPTHKETEVLQLVPKDILDQGEIKMGKYEISYILSYNDIIACVIPETIWVEPGTSREIRNKSLFLTIKYDNKTVLDNKEIRTNYFEEIKDAHQFILGPQDSAKNWFKVVDDILIVKFGAYVEDTDWGYQITLRVDKNGQISSTVINADDLGFN